MKTNPLKGVFKKMNRYAAIVLFAVILSLVPCAVTNAAAVGTVISSTSENHEVTSGVAHKTIKEFTSEGWLSINVLQIDLTNPNIRLDALTNNINSIKLTGVKDLADINSAVAAVNANYFYSVGNGNANALGPVISDGEIVSMSDGFNSSADTMATFALYNSKLPAIDYWKTNIHITSPATGLAQSVSNYNRMSSYYFKDVIVLDRNYGKMSVGASEEYPDLVEMVVSDGVVREIRIAQPPVEIPENGYVVISRASDTNFIIKNFQVDYPVVLDVKSSIDWKNINLAVSGSSVLLKDGAVPSVFSFPDPDNIKRNPRTMVGSTKDVKTLYIATVDGRQKASIGMTLAEAAQFMLELGAYNALNLDGGGSTTMVTRPLGGISPSLSNVPSDGGMRGVTTALGILSTAPAAGLAGLVVESEDVNVFVNTSRKLTIRGYDKYFNPVEIKQENIKWSISGVKGTIKKEKSYFVFIPKKIGEAKLTASIGKVKKAFNITSLSSPVRLTLNTSSFNTPVGTPTAITVTGYNVNGYPAHLNPADVRFNVVGIKPKDGKKDVIPGAVDVEGKFIPKESGTGYIDASVGNTHAYCAVSVRNESVLVKDDFESETNRIFTSYPEGTEGSYMLSKDFAYEGSFSGRLSYNFVDSQQTHTAYVNYPEKGITVEPGYDYIGTYVYIPETTVFEANAENLVKVEVVDGDGKAHLLMLSPKMDWTGWKYLQTSISGIKSPAYITRLYVARTITGASQGDVYFDSLILRKTWYSPVDVSTFPVNTVPQDKANVPGGKFKAASNSLRFAVMGQSTEPSTDIQKSIIENMTDKINKYIDTSAIVGNSAHAFTKNFKKKFVATYKGFKTYTVKNSLFIQLDMYDGSLRTSDSEQWSGLLKALESAKSQNVFLFLANSPYEMSDQLEAKLFKDTLTNFKKATKKNVWVFFSGSEDRTYMERGVKYVSSRGYNVEDLNSKTVNTAKYFLVTVKGSTVTYELKPMNN